MRIGFSQPCLDHDTGDRHPESPDRLVAIRRELTRHHGIEYADPPPATRDALEAVHDPDYVQAVKDFCADGGGQWDPDTVAVEATWDAALASAGLAQWSAQTALEGAIGRETPFALGRPPGHHAVVDDAMGFCFFNNAAVAAQSVLDDDSADRVAILDWDVHHGNGTQDLFYDRADVLYASIHEEGLYPGTGAADEIGEGPGRSFTINVPLPAGAGDAAYRTAAEELLGPRIETFDPDLLLVSAGFDAHQHDPISRMRVSTEGYGWLAQWIRGVAESGGAGLGFVLEGGYSLDMLAEGVGIVTEVFDGYEPIRPDGEPDASIAEALDEIAADHGDGSK